MGGTLPFGSINGQVRGVLSDLLGDRGIIDMGIRKEATVEEAVLKPRRRRHPTGCLMRLKHS